MGKMTMKSTRRVLGHPLLRSLARSHHSLIRFLRTARFARALRSAHSFVHSLTNSLRSSWERGSCLWNDLRRFHTFSTHCGVIPSRKECRCQVWELPTLRKRAVEKVLTAVLRNDTDQLSILILRFRFLGQQRFRSNFFGHDAIL